jgi:hypothetical protein
VLLERHGAVTLRERLQNERHTASDREKLAFPGCFNINVSGIGLLIERASSQLPGRNSRFLRHKRVENKRSEAGIVSRRTDARVSFPEVAVRGKPAARRAGECAPLPGILAAAVVQRSEKCLFLMFRMTERHGGDPRNEGRPV